MVDQYERNKDFVQELVESTATHVGQITTIITGAIAGVAREIGEIFSDGFEMREASRRARADEHGVIDAEIADRSDDHRAPTTRPAVERATEPRIDPLDAVTDEPRER